MKIGYIGMSHLGVISSICAAEKGFEVLCFDENMQNIDSLKKGTLLFFEPDLEKLYEKNKSRITYTHNIDDMAFCDIVYISQDVPTDDLGNSDLSKITLLINEITQKLKKEAILIILSQIPPGFTRSVPFDKERLFYQVETLIFGRAVDRALFPERFIIGSAGNSIPPFYENYLKTYNCPLFIMKYESAELAKIAINMFLVSTVTTTNTIAEMCEKINADWNEIIPVLKLDKRIGTNAYLKPGLGIAGGNLERDLITFRKLAIKHNTDFSVVQAWQANSEHRSSWAFRKFKEIFPNNNKKRKIGILGLAYKENTASVKNSASLSLILNLKDNEIHAYDPVVRFLPDTFGFVKICNNVKDVYQVADLLFIMTPWEEFKEIEIEEVSQCLFDQTIFDPYGILNKKNCEKHSLKYYQLGC